VFSALLLAQAAAVAAQVDQSGLRRGWADPSFIVFALVVLLSVAVSIYLIASRDADQQTRTGAGPAGDS
jgi:hypothetical protein